MVMNGIDPHRVQSCAQLAREYNTRTKLHQEIQPLEKGENELPMNELPSERLELLSRLAGEYERKHQEIDAICRAAQRDMLPHQLKVRGEMTTDRFRGAQQYLLGALHAPGEPPREKDEDMTLKAVVVMIRCFDEMRILFESLKDFCCGPVADEEPSEGP